MSHLGVNLLYQRLNVADRAAAGSRQSPEDRFESAPVFPAFCFVPAAGPLLANGTSTNLPDAASRKAFITRNCIGCHNQKLNTAGLSLQGLDFADVSSHGMIWEKVLTRIHTGQMPPAPLPKPDPALAAAFTTWLERSLDDVSIKKPNPGRPAIHRLNRAEYSNAIRDLLAVDTDPGATLPVDDSGYGFDNIGDVLSMSPVLLERYMSTARRSAAWQLAIFVPNPLSRSSTCPAKSAGRARPAPGMSG